METFDALGELLMKRYEAEYDNMRKSLPSLFNMLRADRNLLFDNVYWDIIQTSWVVTASQESLGTELEENITINTTFIYQHKCGSKGGRYRISKKGTCYKCKKMIGSYKQLDTIRGLKALTEKEEDHTFGISFNVSNLSDNVIVNIGYAKT